MKRREQALLLLRKAVQDEALLDHVLTLLKVGDEIIGFHRQQAAVAVGCGRPLQKDARNRRPHVPCSRRRLPCTRGIRPPRVYARPCAERTGPGNSEDDRAAEGSAADGSRVLREARAPTYHGPPASMPDTHLREIDLYGETTYTDH